MSSLLGNPLNTAFSKSNNLFVAPIAMTLLSRELEQRPSISGMSQVMTAAQRESAYHLAMGPKQRINLVDEGYTGGSLRARENTALTNFSPSPAD
jgi:hypothetical protein